MLRASYNLDLAKIVWALRILSHESSWNFRIKEFSGLENHVIMNTVFTQKSASLELGPPF